MNYYKESWMEGMKKRYNTDEEGVREIMRERQRKSRENYTGSGGFKKLSKERRQEISRMGVEKRRQLNQEAD